MPRKSYIYKDQAITQDDQAFLFASLGLADEGVTLPAFANPPIINIMSVKADAIINLHPDNPPTKDGFTIIVGAIGQVPSVANPILFTFEIIDQDAIQLPSPTALITPAYVKDRFPEWQTYCTRQDALKTPDEMLQIAIDDAIEEFQSFVGTLTVSLVTGEYTLHLLNIVKYNCFNFRHGDTKFKEQPNIIKDYELTRALLEKGLVGAKNIAINDKDRIFDEWFTDNNPLWYE